MKLVGGLRFSPSGDQIAFVDHPFWPDDRGSVAITDLEGKKKTISRPWESIEGLAWAPGAKELWFTATSAGVDRSLWAVTLVGKQRLVLSVPSTLRLYDISSDGRVLLSAGHERVGMIGLTAPDDRGRDLSWSGWTVASDISPDGRWVLFDEQSEFAGENYTVAMRNIEGSPPVKLGEGDIGHFSPDGKWVTAAVNGQPPHFMLLPTGAGEPKDVPVPDLAYVASVDFMPNGNVVLTGSERGHGVRCYTRAIDGGPTRAVTPEGTGLCRCSPDARNFLARDHLGNLAVYRADGGQAHALPDSESMYPIRWADNHSILAFRTGELPGRVVQIDIATGKSRLIKELSPGDRAGVTQIQIVAATADARAFAYSYQQVLYDLYVVDGLR